MDEEMNKPTRVRVTTVTMYTVDAGEIPGGAIAMLIEKAAYPQSLSLGETDWFLGYDYGTAQTESVQVEVIK